MAKESFVIFKGFYEPIKLLSNEDLGQLFRALFEYQINGIEPTNTSRIFMPFQFFKNQFRLDEDKYLAVCQRNKSNGLNGGRKPKETQNNPVGFKEPKQPDKEKDNDKDNEKIDFSVFWSLYPVKKGKAKCEPKWNKLTETEKQKIITTLPNFITNKPFPTYTHPFPETYLNQKRWDDELNNTPVLTDEQIKKQRELDFLSRL